MSNHFIAALPLFSPTRSSCLNIGIEHWEHCRSHPFRVPKIIGIASYCSPFTVHYKGLTQVINCRQFAVTRLTYLIRSP